MSDVAKRLMFASESAPTDEAASCQTPHTPCISRWQFVAFLQGCDILTVILAAVGAWYYATRDAAAQALMLFAAQAPSVWESLAFAVVLAAVLHCLLRVFGGYRFATTIAPIRSSAIFIACWCVLCAPLLAIALIQLPADNPGRVWMVTWFAAAGLLMSGLRPVISIAGQWLRAQGVLGYTICIVGSGAAAVACAERARHDPSGITVVGYFDNVGAEGHGIPGVPRLGGLADVLPFLARRQLGAVVIALKLTEQRKITDMVTALRRHPIRVLLAPWFDEAGDAPFATKSMQTDIGGMALYIVSERPVAGWCWVFKDLQDRSLALAALLFLSPVLLGAAVAIKLSSPGPVLFRQVRRGYGGKQFRIFKFRTMHQAASLGGQNRLTLTRRDDPRIFPVGGWLRRTSLDELPQLFNVILGDMWLVGPRPHSPLAEAAGVIYADAVADYIARYRIKPGITGWAQVNGWRGPTETLEQISRRVQCDLDYIERWSPWFDARIVIATVSGGLKHENAF
jgi:Undecaprenyl-phosphate glucose phosphotransferase